MSKDEGGWSSSLSEKPVRSRLRRLVDWIKKVHSLTDKVYKRKTCDGREMKASRGNGAYQGQGRSATGKQRCSES